MTTEEKAKAYDEALEKARIYRDNAKAVEEYAAAARYENIFPQLRESEDERMAEMAIKAVLSPEAQSCIKSWGVSPDDVIAWLEKQKEQKPAEWSEEDEKMLVHVVELLELNCDFSEINNEISWLKSLSRKKIWNKEDERILKGIVGLIDHNQHYDVSNKDMLNWLKSLRPHWKPSEEQIQALEYVVSSIPPNYLKEQKYVMALIGQVIQQLKKLLYGSTEKVIHKARED